MNPPWDSDIDEEELLGPVTDISVPRGHSDDSVALVIPQRKTIYDELECTCRTG